MKKFLIALLCGVALFGLVMEVALLLPRAAVRLLEFLRDAAVDMVENDAR